VPNIGGPELIIVLLLAVLLFGAKKLPDLGRSMGQSITNFKKGINEAKDEDRPAVESTTTLPDGTVTSQPRAENSKL
jgi:sec-independent protein translocase protein TatA